jgi:hypothetical protein
MALRKLTVCVVPGLAGFTRVRVSMAVELEGYFSNFTGRVFPVGDREERFYGSAPLVPSVDSRGRIWTGD